MRRLLSSSSGSEVQSQLTFGLEKSFAVAELDVNPDVAVLPVGLDEQHALRARRGQAMRQHAAGVAGADDDVVERFCLSPHGLPPYANASRSVMFYRRMTERDRLLEALATRLAAGLASPAPARCGGPG